MLLKSVFQVKRGSWIPYRKQGKTSCNAYKKIHYILRNERPFFYTNFRSKGFMFKGDCYHIAAPNMFLREVCVLNFITGYKIILLKYIMYLDIGVLVQNRESYFDYASNNFVNDSLCLISYYFVTIIFDCYILDCMNN